MALIIDCPIPESQSIADVKVFLIPFHMLVKMVPATRPNAEKIPLISSQPALMTPFRISNAPVAMPWIADQKPEKICLQPSQARDQSPWSTPANRSEEHTSELQ